METGNYSKGRKPIVKRAEIYFADLKPVIGCEQGGCRPVLIVQNNKGNYYGSTTIVIPLTKQNKKETQVTHAFLGKVLGLNEDSMALCEQIRVIDKQRLLNKVAILEAKQMERIEFCMIKAIESSLKDKIRGSIYLTNLNPALGREEAGIRPVLVIQNETGNRFSPTTIILPIQQADKKMMKTHIKLKKVENLKTESMILSEQIRVIDKTRLTCRLTHIDNADMQQVDEVLYRVLGIKTRRKTT